jgi:hypothetical protein
MTGSWVRWTLPLGVAPLYWFTLGFAAPLRFVYSEAVFVAVVMLVMFVAGALVPRAWVALAIIVPTTVLSFGDGLYHGHGCPSGPEYDPCGAGPDPILDGVPLPYPVLTILAAAVVLAGQAARLGARVLVYSFFPESPLGRRFRPKSRSARRPPAVAEPR